MKVDGDRQLTAAEAAEHVHQLELLHEPSAIFPHYKKGSL
jgi:hypothetical protein